MGMLACQEQQQTEIPEKTLTKIDVNLDSLQVTLTNQFSFKDGRFARGGASFLVEGKQETLLCTAKHLLGEPMGISPKVRTGDFEHLLNFWEAYAYEGNQFEDTLFVDGLLNKQASMIDILLLKVKEVPKGIQVLKPRFTKAAIGESFDIIACEQGDGVQRKFPVVMDEFNRANYIVRAREKFNPQAMSGSPVVDRNGRVIGVLIGGGQFEGSLYLTVEPLGLVKKYF